MKAPGFDSFESLLFQLCLDALTEAVVINLLIEQTDCLCNLDTGGSGSADRCIARLDWDGKCDVRADLAGSIAQEEMKMAIGASNSFWRSQSEAVGWWAHQ